MYPSPRCAPARRSPSTPCPTRGPGGPGPGPPQLLRAVRGRAGRRPAGRRRDRGLASGPRRGRRGPARRPPVRSRSAGAWPGDVLRLDFLELIPRVPYGVISSRHGYGALAGELPVAALPRLRRRPVDPEKAGAVSTFCRAVDGHGQPGVPGGRGVAIPARALPRHRRGDPQWWHSAQLRSAGAFRRQHGRQGPGQPEPACICRCRWTVPGCSWVIRTIAQGHGEVALTALEAPLRATLRGDGAAGGRRAVHCSGCCSGPLARPPSTGSR